ncbi:CAAD domain-containing protein [Vulcanococcus limneticus]|uniref:CAAD domain-containing protein n=1 Tax=Vulcanococcus limneticus TaxID=2170428 RepID=UPI00398BD376
MADAFAASNEGPQPTDSSPDGRAGTDQGEAPLEPPTSLFRHTETAPGTGLPLAAESPLPADVAQGEPTGEPQHLELTEPTASAFDAPAPEPSEPAQPPQVIAVEPTPAAPEAPASPPAPTAPAEPSVATTIEVPPLEPGEGGEWELLVAKVRQWLASGQLRELFNTARTPLTLLAYLVAAVLVLQIYAALLDVLEDIPLVPGLLELVGVITVVRFALTRLVRSSDRQQVVDGLKSRWNAFRGQG